MQNLIFITAILKKVRNLQMQRKLAAVASIQI